MKKIGVLTFHRSYNCGSMLQAYALQTMLDKMGYDVEIIDFSNEGQKQLYEVFFPLSSLKNLVKNILIFPYRKKIEYNNQCYENFLKRYMKLSKERFSKASEMDASMYYAIVVGSDQIWNITIDDSDDAYFLPWAKEIKKIAYAPSFGARNILDYSQNSEFYAACLNNFNTLSVRENNGKKWIKDMIGKEVPVVLDPTLLFNANTYECLIENQLELPQRYIFYYAPQYEKNINQLVISISSKLNMPVIAFNAKKFYVKRMQAKGFYLPKEEDPSVYLELIKKAELIITTSFHGAVFSSIFRKKFWIVKNGGMLKTDDRVYTMTDNLALSDRIIPIQYCDDFDYCKEKDYSEYEIKLQNYRQDSLLFLKSALSGGDSAEK